MRLRDGAKLADWPARPLRKRFPNETKMAGVTSTSFRRRAVVRRPGRGSVFNWQTLVMVDVELKAALHDELRWAREAMLWKLDGLSEYDVRRPLTATGTNLLGLIKHLSMGESKYLGEVFGRPFH